MALREEERWRMALDEIKIRKIGGQLWKVMNITKDLLKNLRKRRNVFTQYGHKVLKPSQLIIVRIQFQV